ncbi:cysteine desulfurase family protein [Evansella vedderi]|uniref:cysteine desulfurase n=1 Tax=Evansella vedderi TaxID=38282 RepID=A0ABU0A4H0_9BACI|nr:aminotransferase class V-fold PLP-dependent enzyme [Evansella vedderi]MDQ0257573.1 cysteine desulfurase family protein [Evansella vedderi]
MIYLDQAASSFPKPTLVMDSLVKAVREFGANPGRSGHKLARRAALAIEETRVELADLFQAENHNRVIFTQNATTAINQGINGLGLRKGDHAITTTLEHNSIRRPLERLVKEKGISLTYLSPNKDGEITIDQLQGVLKDQTKLVAVTHGSNVTGELLPIKEWGEVLSTHHAKFLVDASQTAGSIPISMKDFNIDLLAFPGHKGLLGPQGVGVLIASTNVQLTPLTVGGTGFHSESPEQPLDWPFYLESGTLNTPGISGLLEGIREIKRMDLGEIYDHERKLVERCIEEFSSINGLEWFAPKLGEKRLGVISFRIIGIDVHEMAAILDEHYDIAVRAGLHCAPLMHQYLNTIDTGLIRASFGIYNTLDDVDHFITAVKEIREGLLS